MNFREHFETAWELTLKYIAPLIIMTLVMIVVSVLTFGILGPVVTAGYMHSVLLMLREGREPNVRDIFSHMGLFFPLLGFSILVFLAVLTGFVLFVLPGIIIFLAFSYFCLYMLTLMTDRGLGLFKAIKESYSLVKEGSLVDNLAVFIIVIGLLSVGSSTFLGALFTQPFATTFLLAVYLEKTKQGRVIEVNK